MIGQNDHGFFGGLKYQRYLNAIEKKVEQVEDHLDGSNNCRTSIAHAFIEIARIEKKYDGRLNEKIPVRY